MVIIITIVKII